MDLARMRDEYEAAGIDPVAMAADPVEQFHRWLEAAVEAALVEPNAMVLATVDADGQPWSRHVLLKAAAAQGFDFYTNYESNKSNELAAMGKASLTFGWLGLRRQVNIAGSVERVPDAESEAYWAVRPRGSQLGGWASAQSRPVADREEIEAAYAAADARFAEGRVPRPSHWGGWRVVPHTIEFWQGRQNRLHDRLRYTLSDTGWKITRHMP